jgi:hypothetical protein
MAPLHTQQGSRTRTHVCVHLMRLPFSRTHVCAPDAPPGGAALRRATARLRRAAPAAARACCCARLLLRQPQPPPTRRLGRRGHPQPRPRHACPPAPPTPPTPPPAPPQPAPTPLHPLAAARPLASVSCTRRAPALRAQRSSSLHGELKSKYLRRCACARVCWCGCARMCWCACARVCWCGCARMWCAGISKAATRTHRDRHGTSTLPTPRAPTHTHTPHTPSHTHSHTTHSYTHIHSHLNSCVSSSGSLTTRFLA